MSINNDKGDVVYNQGDIVYIMEKNRIVECRVMDVLHTGNGTSLRMLRTMKPIAGFFNLLPIFNTVTKKAYEVYLSPCSLTAALIAQFDSEKSEIITKALVK